MEKIAGVDTSKANLDVFIAPDCFETFANNEDGISKLQLFLSKNNATMAVFEASGGVEKLPYYLLWDSGIPCAIVNAASVRAFAKAMGYIEKTDKIDAKVIAHFAQTKAIVPMPPPSLEQRKLIALNTRMRQISSDISIQKQRLHSVTEAQVLDSIKEVIALLETQKRCLSDEISKIIFIDPVWKHLDEIFRTVKGVANRTIATLFATLPEIGTISHKAISKLVGVAPIADDSGKRNGARSIRGGREEIRSMLFLVSEIVRKYDPSLNEFRERLLNSGKPKMVVRIAVAHKLLIRLNAKARDTRKYLALNA